MNNRIKTILTLVALLLGSANAYSKDALQVGERLNTNESLSSLDGRYRFILQGDGNLVLRNAAGAALWASATNGKGGVRLNMQGDGNLVLYTSAGSAVWSTKTNGTAATRAVLQDDGNFVLYTTTSNAVWATHTVQSDTNAGGNSDPMVEILNQVRSRNGTLILDWDNTIDIDANYTLGETASQWMNAFAEANIDAWLVTGNGNTSRIEQAVMAGVKTANQSYWKNLLSSKAFYGEATGTKDDKYLQIMGGRSKWQFMIADDASANIEDFRAVTSGQGYVYQPRMGYATYDEMLGHLKNFQLQLQQGGSTQTAIQHVGTTQVWDSDGQGLKITRPTSSKTGDLLVLILHRTDDLLPFAVSGWNRQAECYKEDNGYQCLNVSDCTSLSGGFCTRFQNKYNGRDLAQVVFTKTAGASEPSSYSFNLNQDSSGHPGWAILTALRGANTSSPVRAWANKGCDGDADSLFPSVEGRKGDLLLLSQSFDDAVAKDLFGAPSGMSTFGYIANSDESGFLYGAVLTSDGQTGVRRTSGPGASACKDALVSFTVKPK